MAFENTTDGLVGKSHGRDWPGHRQSEHTPSPDSPEPSSQCRERLGGCYATIIAKQPEGRGLSDSGIQTTGLYLCGFLTAVLTLLKFLGTIDWSWWRIGLPLGVYLGFQAAYIVTGFIYLSQAGIEERPPEEETELLPGHNDIPYFWLAWVNFILCGVGVSEWAQPSHVWNGFCHAFGKSRCDDRVWWPCRSQLVPILVEYWPDAQWLR